MYFQTRVTYFDLLWAEGEEGFHAVAFLSANARHVAQRLVLRGGLNFASKILVKPVIVDAYKKGDRVAVENIFLNRQLKARSE